VTLTPAWVDAAVVQLHVGGAVPDDELQPYVTAAAAYVAARRPDLQLVDTSTPADAPGDVQLGLALLVARWRARRGTSLGLQSFDAGVVGSVVRADTDVARLLGIGVHTLPAIG